MKRRSPRNVAASVRQRLLNLAHQRGEDFQFVLTRFALERLLYRLSTSRHADRFLLKGALLFTIWSEQVYRPTRDLDLSARGEASPEGLKEVFRDLCQPIDSTDGLLFEDASLRAVPRLRAYPQETVIAEKFHAMVFLGIVNSRVRDFYDLWLLSRGFDFAGETLVQAIRATFERRQTRIPAEIPVALTEEFSQDPRNRRLGTAFSGEPGRILRCSGFLKFVSRSRNS